MAVSRTNERANIRLTNNQNRSIVGYSSVKPDAQPTALKQFSEAIGLVRGRAIGFTYLNVTADLVQN